MLSICWAVSVDPPVWAWNRSFIDSGFFAPKRSRMIRAHMRRAARNFATSSKKLLWALKKNESWAPNRSTSSPAATAASTYATALARVNASSWAAVAPASRMWYPLIEIVFHFGRWVPHQENVSVTRRIDGPGG